jgi:hypothetical protein
VRQCFVASQPSSSNEPANPPRSTSRGVNRKDEMHEVISRHVGSPALHPQVTINAEHNPATSVQPRFRRSATHLASWRHQLLRKVRDLMDFLYHGV